MELRLKLLRASQFVFFIAIFLTCIAKANENKIHFEKKHIFILSKQKKITIQAEIAETNIQYERGLMFRTKLEKNSGMLFIFNNEDIRAFWMKNTLIDLSIGYFDKHKKLVDIQEMKATSMLQTEIPSYPSKSPAMYALEMPSGWYSLNNVKLGSVLEIP